MESSLHFQKESVKDSLTAAVALQYGIVLHAMAAESKDAAKRVMIV